MANIFLTRSCNLKCPYCFADEFVNKDSQVVSINNFKKAVEFVKTRKDERIGLIGGEPTLHPDFKEILEILVNDNDVKNVIIYTNGLKIDKYFDEIRHEKIHLLVNSNSPSDLGIGRYEKLKQNINKLRKVKNDLFSLGINLYSKNMDYSYIFDLLKIADKNHLRFSLALPNTSKESSIDVLSNFREMKPFLFSFFKDCLENKISPTNDCNPIPDCLLTIDDRKLLIQLASLSKRNPITTLHTCSPVIDILPDLTAVRCFGLSKYMKVPISNFRNLDNLAAYFYNKIDLYARLAYVSPECENCKIRCINKCGICFTYKLKQMEKIKEFALQLADDNKQ